jgi:2-methylisocitrate lyase-like PEP mutase family enzyme
MTDKDRQKQKADDFLALHHAPTTFILPNAWDVASEMIFALEGFKAIGTTSAGIAAALGYADGQEMTLTDNLQVVERIVNNTHLPVSADIESGYETSVDSVVSAARAVLSIGAVGLNFEDSTGDPSIPLFDKVHQQEKINAMRAMSVAEGVHLVINARTDVYLVGDDDIKDLRSAIERGNAYKEAGADCIFVPDFGNLDRASITTLVDEINAPINIIAGLNTPTISELQDIGVARVSLGPRPMRAMLSLLREIARELKATGTYRLMSESTISYDEVNQWFTRE